MEQPNVIWILVDQLRYHALSCHGDENIATPNIDRLCVEGCTFSNAVTTCPVCTPARAALLTGKYCNTTDVLYLGDLLEPGQKTAAHFFKKAGYRTSYIGKWHLSSQQNPFGHNEGAEYWVHPKLRGGFEDWMGFELSNHFWKTRYCTDGQIWPPKELHGYQTDGLTDLSIEYLSKLRDSSQPWFHVISYEAPHHGSDEHDVASVQVGDIVHTRHPAPKEYEERFDGNSLALRNNVPASHDAAARSMMSQYYAMISNLDDNIGRILKWLDTEGIAENTLICFFSDHGELGGSHGRFQKANPYDESIRIPLIVRWPKSLEGGQTIEEPANLVDVLPTTAGLCGLPVGEAFQGIDFSSRLFGLTDSIPREGSLVQWHGNPRYTPGTELDVNWRAIRTTDLTYVVYEDGEVLLYDNNRDPFQLVNVAGQPGCSETLNRIHEQLVQEVIKQEGILPSYLRSKTV